MRHSSLFIMLGVFSVALIAIFSSFATTLKAETGIHLATPTITVKPEELQIDPHELECLAKNIYFEAGNQSTAGKVAVANVTFNRVDDKDFPNGVCKVVTEGPVSAWHKSEGRIVPILHKCQFSWFCDGKKDIPYDSQAWEESQLIAFITYKRWIEGKTLDITDGALYYHANYVKPSWSKRLNRTVVIDDHIFYR